jgi:hypothetical protein
LVSLGHSQERVAFLLGIDAVSDLIFSTLVFMQLDKEFRVSLINSKSLKEPLSDIIEALLDTMTENEFVRNLPVVGWLLKSVSAVDNIKTKFLVSKILYFINGMSNVSEEELLAFENKQLSDQKSIDKFYESLLISIDRLNHLDKSTIISSLFKSLIHGKINEAFFLRSVNIVESIYIEDLKEYKTGRLVFTYTEIHEKANINQTYLSFGLLISHIVTQNNATQRVHQEAELRFHYVYSSFGRKFIKACNYEI